MDKIKIGVVFGGRSAEHEISLISAYNVMKALDQTKYEIFPIGITEEGDFEYFENEPVLDFDSPKTVKLNSNGQIIYFTTGGFFNSAKSTWCLLVALIMPLNPNNSSSFVIIIS